LRIANKDNLREARDAASRLFDRGSTDIDAALKEGARLIGAGKERPKYVIFLTDGLPTAGVEDIGEIVDNARDRMPESVKLFVFGVGYDVNTTLLDSLSYNHHGSATYVTEGESIEAKVSEFYSRISSPALVDIAVELDGLDTYDVMPRQLPDLFHNHELFITGRFSGEPTRSVNLSVSGSHGNNKQVLEARVDSNYSKKHNTIPRLWATRKVSYLLDQVRLHGDDQELIDQIDRLAMRYGIVTPYTSYLITEPDQFFDEGERQQMLALEMEEAREDDTGAASVNRSKINQQNQAAGQAAAPAPSLGYADGLMDEDSTDGAPAAVNYVNNQTFVRQSVADSEDYQWVDARFEKDEQQVVQITAYSEVYFELVTDYPELGDYLSQGDYVIVVIGEDLVLEITADEVSNTETELEQVRDALADGSYLT
jgi:Ca-activated chloride channel family protein